METGQTMIGLGLLTLLVWLLWRDTIVLLFLCFVLLLLLLTWEHSPPDPLPGSASSASNCRIETFGPAC